MQISNTLTVDRTHKPYPRHRTINAERVVKILTACDLRRDNLKPCIDEIASPSRIICTIYYYEYYTK